MIKSHVSDNLQSAEPPQNELKISLVQAELHWQNPPQNRQMLAEKIACLAGKSDLIILPEMFSSGFSMAPEQVAEPEEGESVQWLQQQAVQLKCAISGSLAIAVDGGYVNRLFLAEPDGNLQYYDKSHLFRMGDEHSHYLPGTQRTIFHYRGWRILPLVCYDLRFPVFGRNRGDYDLLLCVANWPAPRRHPWRTLLQARAIENLCYVAGVNRVGMDGNGLEYSGDSMLVDFKGVPVLDAEPGLAFIETTTLNFQSLQAFRQAFPAHLDADDFHLSLS
ncbi:MAG: amidohydrolase [Marinobacterium sp.]|nr:amidohydrolase [Marinobacterium sp.]